MFYLHILKVLLFLCQKFAMKLKITLFIILTLPLFLSAQNETFQKSYEHFEESRGDTDFNPIVTLPYEKVVPMVNPLNSTSGLGPTFNYFGTVVVVDQMNRLPNGNLQLVLRREDGRNFYGFRPTLKAVLTR